MSLTSDLAKKCGELKLLISDNKFAEAAKLSSEMIAPLEGYIESTTLDLEGIIDVIDFWDARTRALIGTSNYLDAYQGAVVKNSIPSVETWPRRPLNLVVAAQDAHAKLLLSAAQASKHLHRPYEVCRLGELACEVAMGPNLTRYETGTEIVLDVYKQFADMDRLDLAAKTKMYLVSGGHVDVDGHNIVSGNKGVDGEHLGGPILPTLGFHYERSANDPELRKLVAGLFIKILKEYPEVYYFTYDHREGSRVAAFWNSEDIRDYLGQQIYDSTKAARELNLLISGQQTSQASAFISKGFDVNGVDLPSGWSPLHAAARSGSLELVKLLISAGVQVDARTFSGGTPLIVACEENHLEVAKCLLAAGANPNRGDIMLHTPLHRASYFGSLDCAKLLLEHGSLLTARTTDGETPLHTATGAGHVAIVELLLKSGAQVNDGGFRNATALMVAVSDGKRDLVQRLLSAGADPNLKDYSGLSAFDFASPEISKLLTEVSSNA